jgi:heparan sulfate 6-O-sulfotransferase HS6ST1
VQRYLSEYKHVKRGATWRKAELRCGNRSWAEAVPHCYGESEEEEEWGDWSGVSLQEFMACPTNLAVNRQTRMLADLALVDCYNTSSMPTAKREAIMVASAKTNLERMAYFGLTEQQKISQYLFEETFNLRFKENFEQLSAVDTHSGATQDRLGPEVIAKIEQLNHLDAELHRFATKLLQDRFQAMSDSDQHFSEHMLRLGQEKYQFSWSDIEDENYDEDSYKLPVSTL